MIQARATGAARNLPPGPEFDVWRPFRRLTLRAAENRHHRVGFKGELEIGGNDDRNRRAES
jgi:hypothetical protein